MTSTEPQTGSMVERMTEQERFQRFANKLADFVLIHINTPGSGPVRPGHGNGYCCPLGCHPSIGGGKPFAAPASMYFEASTGDLMSFIRGFEHSNWCASGPYYELGQLYRARFL